MKTLSHSKILAGVSCALALAACDSIKDVPNEDAAILPAQTVVLSGQIYGLSSLRAITLMNNGDTINTRSFINAAPTVPNEGVRPVPFSFGSIAVGTAYNIAVKDQPEFKNCTVTNGSGTITLGVQPNVSVTCTNTAARYNLSVYLPDTQTLFKALEGAKVRVTTEEEIREVAVTATTTSPIVFTGVLINATGALNAATWSVNATTFEGNRINKCVVTFPSGTNSTGHVSAPGVAPVVGAVVGTNTNATAAPCQFTVGGRISYSLPPGQTTIPAITGLRLQLRDLQMNVIQSMDVGNCSPSASTTTTTSTTTLAVAVPVVSPIPGTPPSNLVPCEYRFTTPVRSSTTDGIYEVAVLQHPVGQFCVVVNGGSASVFTQGTTPPVNVDNANVFCRATPPANRQLRGVFRLQSTTYVANAAAPVPVTSAWEPFDFTKQNTASSNMMALFDNGTFLYGAHANGVQVEHGFYDYDNVAQTLRFTVIVDTNTGTAFPTTFSPLLSVATTSTAATNITHMQTTTAGISALPNPIKRNGTAAPSSTVTGFANFHAAMTGVTLGTVVRQLDVGVTANLRTISGTFGADAAGISSNSPASAARVSWTLEEAPQVNGEFTGAWTTRDSRRLWVWDYRTYYGTSVGMSGGSPSMNDACFSMEELHAPNGIYTRRGSGTGCYPFARPGNDPVSGAAGVSVFGSITPRNGLYPAYAAGTGEAADHTIAPFTLNPIIPQLPGYTGRHPGGEPAPGTSSPSPIYFHVAPAASFASTADATYFPSPDTSWCTTEMLGVRSTANGFPINYPVYFCRTRAN
jgi:hypothetical protein